MTSETDQRVDSVLSKFRETVVARESPVSDTNPFALPPDLAERVATFAAARWPAEPRSIDALSCARRGWKCVGPELLECAGCGRKLQCPASVALPSAPDDPEREIRRRAAGRFAGMLDAEHSGRCLYAEWNYADADLAFPKLPSAENARWLRNRASTWDAVPDNKLPKTLLVGGKPWTEQVGRGAQPSRFL